MKNIRLHMSNKIKQLPQNIVFTVISLLLAFFVRIPLIPALPFLKLDISDTPILIAALLSEASSGICILFVTSVLRFLLFSSAGLIGLIIRMTSITLIIAISFMKKNNIHILAKVCILVFGIILCLAIKLPINYISWVYIFGVPKDLVSNLMIPYIIPFNIFKAALNYILAFIFVKPCKNILNKIYKTL